MDKMSIDEMIDELAIAANQTGWYECLRIIRSDDDTLREFCEKSFITFRDKTQMLLKNLHEVLKELTWK